MTLDLVGDLLSLFEVFSPFDPDSLFYAQATIRRRRNPSNVKEGNENADMLVLRPKLRLNDQTHMLPLARFQIHF